MSLLWSPFLIPVLVGLRNNTQNTPFCFLDRSLHRISVFVCSLYLETPRLAIWNVTHYLCSSTERNCGHQLPRLRFFVALIR